MEVIGPLLVASGYGPELSEYSHHDSEISKFNARNSHDNIEPPNNHRTVQYPTMSATLEATRPAGQKKTFGKSTREVPHHSQKAKKWYPADDESQAKKVGRHCAPGSRRSYVPIVIKSMELGLCDYNVYSRSWTLR